MLPAYCVFFCFVFKQSTYCPGLKPSSLAKHNRLMYLFFLESLSVSLAIWFGLAFT